MANITVTYTFTNATTSDGPNVSTNFTDIINGTSDGTKDFSISALTCAGTVTMNGAVNLGNATGDDITFTGRISSTFVPKTNAVYDLGTVALGWQAIYLDDGTTSGGSVYFNNSTTAFLKSNAAGTELDLGGFTNFDFNTGNLKGAGTITCSGNVTNGTFLFTGGALTGVTTIANSGIITTGGIIKGPDGTVNAPTYSFTNDTDTGVYLSSTGQLAFAAGGVKGMDVNAASIRILQNLGVGSTPSHLLHVNAGNTSNEAVVFENSGSGRCDFFINDLQSSDSSNLQINTSTGEVFYPTSSIRYKENVENVLDSDFIYKLRPVWYTWKDDGRKGLGFIAEEVAEVAPVLTFKGRDGLTQGVHYEKMVSPIIAELQKLRIELDDLKKKVKLK